MVMIIAPSILAADFGNLARDIQMVNASEAEWIHLDIMDGVFVPNISYGFPVVSAIAKEAKKVLDAHLMIVDPDRYVENFAKMGVEYLSVHYEACTHLHRSLQNIRNLGMKAGVALNPHTPVHLLEDILEECDYVLLMSVNPGFGGQKFIENCVKKVSTLKEMILKRNLNTLIEVDGGVNRHNAPILAAAGADALVAGSSVFNAPDPIAEIIALKG
ncbi:MAG: ribulose-phosphate 3-epimerase [Bacteroidales bacterium]|nr:ribulose-phosphate 3-epimerase [Bacteroidales bacterium]MBO7763453.1 ribulose-phosphate 3-epimerase [Bacteroidales bacterium]